MTRVIHTGDTHLGYRQYHSPERRADFLGAFRQVAADAAADGVDAVVHAGDLFHDRGPSLRDIHGAIGVLRDLRDAGIPFLAVVGNHERTRDEQWLDLFETLGLATRLGREPVTVGDVALYGLDFVPRSKRDDLDYDFAPHDAAHAALVAHGPFTPFVPDVRADTWDLETVIEESTVAFDALLLGDEHAADTAEVAGTWATYCGSTERVDASEREDRGYNIVAFDGDVSITRRGLDTRDFLTIDLDLAPGEGIDRVRERVAEEDVEDAVVVVSITGDGEEVPAARIEEFARERGALIARVTDRREFEAEEAAEIRFSDPDEAVRERLRDLGLSEAAFALDETVRGDAADANVRGRAKERVQALLENDPGAFTTTADPGDGGVEVDEVGGDDTDDADTPEGDGARVEPAGPAEPGSEPESVADDPGADGADRDDATVRDDDAPREGASGEGETSGDESDGDAPAGGDGQVSMEDYL